MNARRKHTPDALRHELSVTGNSAEIADLSLLIMNSERPKGAPRLEGVSAASNRQAQRRYHRERTRDQNGVRNPTRRAPAVGDHVRVPDGQVWLVTHLDGDMIRSDLGAGLNRCPVGLVTIVDAPTAPAPSAPLPPASNGRAEAAEALYQGVWDAYEVQDWAALERALRAYELSTS